MVNNTRNIIIKTSQKSDTLFRILRRRFLFIIYIQALYLLASLLNVSIIFTIFLFNGYITFIFNYVLLTAINYFKTITKLFNKQCTIWKLPQLHIL